MKLTLRTRLLITTLAVALIGLATGIVNYVGFNKLGAGMHWVADVGLVAQRQLVLADMYHEGVAAVIYRSMIPGQSAEAVSELKKDYEDVVSSMRECFKLLSTLELKPAQKEVVRQFQSGVDAYLAKADEVFAISIKDQAAGLTRLESFKQSFDTLAELTDVKGKELIDQLRSQCQADVESADKARSRSVALAASGFLAAIVLGLLTSSSLARLIGGVVLNVQESTEKVKRAAEEISGASHSLAEGANSQASSLEETSASLEEMSSMVRRTGERIVAAKSLSGETRKKTEDGDRSLASLRESISGIRSSTVDMRGAMNDIQNASEEVAKIVKSIDEIAFQTNILALNAAVEAARAGDAGMGFAVVADEVRALAERSARSARETADKIEDSIRKSERGVAVSDKVATALLAAEGRSEEVQQSLSSIADRAREVDDVLAQITEAATQQSAGIQQLNQAVGQIDHVVQANAARSEECSASSLELKELATELVGSTSSLVEIIGGADKEIRGGGFDADEPAPVPNGNKGARQNSTTSKGEQGYRTFGQNGITRSAGIMPPQVSDADLPINNQDLPMDSGSARRKSEFVPTPIESGFRDH